MQLDFFRIVFFSSPAWITCIVAPLQKDRQFLKLLAHAAVAFLTYWLLFHSYPCQCRHAWGTRMVSDPTFWGNEQAMQAAIAAEKDNFYVLKDIKDPGLREIFLDATPNNGSLDDGRGARSRAPDPTEDGGQQVWTYMKGMLHDSEASGDHEQRVRKWLAPLAGSRSLDALKLRAYCNLHNRDLKMPYVFPLRVLGLEADLNLPCEYWTCVLTEARTRGKQIFWIVPVVAAVLTWSHYRLQCELCTKWLGTGSPRSWWAWFWATLVPFLSVLFLKTTYDEELGPLVEVRFRQAWHVFSFWLRDPSHQVTFAVLCVGLLVLYIYRDNVKSHMGWHESHVYQCFFTQSRQSTSAQEQMLEEWTFQICIWRLDLYANSASTHALGDCGSDIEGGEMQEGSDQHVLLGDGDKRRRAQRDDNINCLLGGRGQGSCLLGGGLGGMAALLLNRREEDNETLKTSDGRKPKLQIRVLYGHREVQGTRCFRPTQEEWMNKAPVYIQENFKVTVPYRPGQTLRIEVQDVGAPLGIMPIGEVSFDESKLKQLFEVSARAQKGIGAPSVQQVVKLVAADGIAARTNSYLHQEMRALGFEPHVLSDGGAVWLALCETGSEQADDGMLCDCCEGI